MPLTHWCVGLQLQVEVYRDNECRNFVEREFPEYYDAWTSMPTAVDRSNFFHYMVVLRKGGVYADLDVECVKSLDTLIRPKDTLIVGYDDQVSSDAEALQRSYARRRQVLPWFFAGAADHPVLREVCDSIAANARVKLSNDTDTDTKERTGTGVWTDITLKHALAHPLAQVSQM